MNVRASDFFRREFRFMIKKSGAHAIIVECRFFWTLEHEWNELFPSKTIDEKRICCQKWGFVDQISFKSSIFTSKFVIFLSQHSHSVQILVKLAVKIDFLCYFVTFLHEVSKPSEIFENITHWSRYFVNRSAMTFVTIFQNVIASYFTYSTISISSLLLVSVKINCSFSIETFYYVSQWLRMSQRNFFFRFFSSYKMLIDQMNS